MEKERGTQSFVNVFSYHGKLNNSGVAIDTDKSVAITATNYLLTPTNRYTPKKEDNCLRERERERESHYNSCYNSIIIFQLCSKAGCKLIATCEMVIPFSCQVLHNVI